MQILIIKTSAIGDVIHTLPALTMLRRAYPDAQITWLVEEAAAGILEGHPALDRILVARRKSWIRALKRGRLGALGEFIRFARELRKTKYDLLVDFQGLLKSSMWVVLARATRKAGFGRGMEHAEGSWIFLNERVPAIDMDVHALDRGIILLEHLGVPRAQLDYGMTIEDDVADEAANLLTTAGLGGDGPLVAINPVAKWPTKLWFPERFAAVADELVAAGCRVVFTGGREDAAAIDDIERQMHSTTIRVDGRTSLRGLAAVLDHADVLLSTDTGPMHLACAVGTPVVAIFGPTAPWRTGPHGDRNTVLRVELTCSPCLKRDCRTRAYEPMACMNRLEADEVARAVLEKLDIEPELVIGR
ncbi:MAG: lipopolysaccharide heptosyltransferase I [Planctomycetota bacterium]